MLDGNSGQFDDRSLNLMHRAVLPSKSLTKLFSKDSKI